MATDRSAARVQITTGVVSTISTRSGDVGLALARAGHERAAPRRAHPRASHEMFVATNARSGRISERLRSPFAQQIPPIASLLDHDSGRRKNRQLRTGRIADRHLWRQLQLARPGLVSDQLPLDRIAPAISSLLRR